MRENIGIGKECGGKIEEWKNKIFFLEWAFGMQK
jgi:hypothetical protein